MKPYESRFPKNLLRQYRELVDKFRPRYFHDPSEDDPADDRPFFAPLVKSGANGTIPTVVFNGNSFYLTQRGMRLTPLIPIEEVLQQRRKNLEADLKRRYSDRNALDFNFRDFHAVTIECGWGLSLWGIITQMKTKGNFILRGARASCGARDILDQKLTPFYTAYANLEIPAIDFEMINPDYDMKFIYSVLYLGPGALLNMDIIDEAATNIAQDPRVSMAVKGMK